MLQCDFCEKQLDPLLPDLYEMWQGTDWSSETKQSQDIEVAVCKNCVSEIALFEDMGDEIVHFLRSIKPDIDIEQAENSMNRAIYKIRQIISAGSFNKKFGRSEAAAFLAICMFADKDGKAELTIDQIALAGPLAERMIDKLGLFPRRRK